MDEDDKFEYQIKQIEIKNISVGRSPSVRMNNFYSLATILIMSVVILWYSNYVLPAFEKQKEKELQAARFKLQEQINSELAQDSSAENQLKIMTRVMKDFSDENN